MEIVQQELKPPIAQKDGLIADQQARIKARHHPGKKDLAMIKSRAAMRQDSLGAAEGENNKSCRGVCQEAQQRPREFGWRI